MASQTMSRLRISQAGSQLSRRLAASPSSNLPLFRSIQSSPLPSSSLPSSSILPLQITRLAHSIPRPTPIQPREPSQPSSSSTPTSESPRPKIKNSAYYQISFTCVPCGHRSHHNVSKQGYHTGSTLITCPECRNRHVISDHLGIFGDRKITIEDIMREKGQLVKRGSLGEDGDIEFWPEVVVEAGEEGGDTTTEPAAMVGDGEVKQRKTGSWNA